MLETLGAEDGWIDVVGTVEGTADGSCDTLGGEDGALDGVEEGIAL